MNALHIQNAHLVDPQQNLNGVYSLWVKNGKIASIGETPPFAPDETLNAQGLILCPGLIDLSARLNSIEAELAAAAAGGVTTLVVPPDADPPLDEPELADRLVHRAKDLKKSKVLPLGALTLGLKGEQLAELAGLKKAGCVAFSQSNRPILSTEILRRAMEYAATFNFPLWVEPQDYWLSKNGLAHSGLIADRLGLAGIPVAAETIAIATFLALLDEIPLPLHFHKLSTQKGVWMVQEAMAKNLPVTFDVDIHHLLLDESDIDFFNTEALFTPPLRAQSDKEALGKAVIKEKMAIASDHTPMGADDKLLPFGDAKPGASAIELLLPLTLNWAKQNGLTLQHAISFLTENPARILGIASGSLKEGFAADFILLNEKEEWEVNAQSLKSRGKNSPFLGKTLTGRVYETFIDGRRVYSHKIHG